MCLDNYDFPLPAVGRHAVEGIQKKRHMKEKMSNIRSFMA